MGVKRRVQDGNTYYYAFSCQNFYSSHPFSQNHKLVSDDLPLKLYPDSLSCKESCWTNNKAYKEYEYKGAAYKYCYACGLEGQGNYFYGNPESGDQLCVEDCDHTNYGYYETSNGYQYCYDCASHQMFYPTIPDGKTPMHCISSCQGFRNTGRTIQSSTSIAVTACIHLETR